MCFIFVMSAEIMGGYSAALTLAPAKTASEWNVFGGYRLGFRLRFRLIEGRLGVAPNPLAVAKDCALNASGAGFLRDALDYTVVVAELVVWRLKKHYVEVGAFCPLEEQILINFRNVDFNRNHFSLVC